MLKNVGLKRRKGTFYFVSIVYLYFLFSLYILFLYKKNILSRLRTCTLLNKKTNSIQ